MPAKHNPAKLNPLQLRTLTLLQAIARIPGASNRLPDGDIAITQFPHAHGDHFHLGDATVSSRDATGLENQAVWNALTRKGMIKAEWPHQIALTPQGQNYDTGLAGEILHQSGH
jgi:ribosomal protein S19E (S16A)